MPLTVGGGIRTVDDIRRLLNAGADKTSIKSLGSTYFNWTISVMNLPISGNPAALLV